MQDSTSSKQGSNLGVDMTRRALSLGRQRRWAAAAAVAAVALGGFAFACGSTGDGPGGADAATAEGGSLVDSGATETGADAGGGDAGEDSAKDTDADALTDAAKDGADGGPACPGPAGTLDPTFGDGGVVVLPLSGASAQSVLVLPSGKLLVGGHTNPQNFALLRLLANGSLDPSFGTNGLVETKVGTNYNRSYNALALQPDGKIVAVGSADLELGQRSYDFAVVRYQPDGALDPTFGAGGSVSTAFGALAFTADTPTGVVILADGRILVGGYMISGDLTVGDMAFAQYNADGSLDTTFGAGGRTTVDIRGTADQARGLALLSGGKILAAGTTRDPNVSRLDIGAVRLNGDGSLDTTFGIAGTFVTAFGGAGSHTANAIGVDATGKILLAGLYGGNDIGTLRLTASGALDPSFGNGGVVVTDLDGRNDTGSALMVQADGNVVVAASSASGTPTDARVSLLRHLGDGGLDPSFGGAGKVLTALPVGFSSAGTASAGALGVCTAVIVGGWNDEAAGGVPRIGVVRYRR